MGNRIAVLRAGKLQQLGPPASSTRTRPTISSQASSARPRMADRSAPRGPHLRGCRLLRPARRHAPRPIKVGVRPESIHLDSIARRGPAAESPCAPRSSSPSHWAPRPTSSSRPRAPASAPGSRAPAPRSGERPSPFISTPRPCSGSTPTPARACGPEPEARCASPAETRSRRWGPLALSASPPAPPERADGRVEASLWFAYGGKNREVLLSLVEQFHAEQGRHRIKATYQGDYFESLAKLRTAIAAGAAPALTHVIVEVIPIWPRPASSSPSTPSPRERTSPRPRAGPGEGLLGQRAPPPLGPPLQSLHPDCLFQANPSSQSSASPRRPPREELRAVALTTSGAAPDGGITRWGFGARWTGGSGPRSSGGPEVR